MSDWQTIDTAPKDGADILVCYRPRNRNPDKPVYRVAHWTNYCWCAKPGDWHIDPTHWMPLPTPPVNN